MRVASLERRGSPTGMADLRVSLAGAGRARSSCESSRGFTRSAADQLITATPPSRTPVSSSSALGDSESPARSIIT